MARDLSAYLQDIYDACVAIEEVIDGVTLDRYRGKRAVRSSVEREFIIIGEALRRISALDERLFYSISNSRAIIDFRNLLAHYYGAIDRSICMSIQAKASHLRWRSTRSISCSKDAAAAAT